MMEKIRLDNPQDRLKAVIRIFKNMSPDEQKDLIKKLMRDKPVVDEITQVSQDSLAESWLSEEDDRWDEIL